MPIRTNHYNTSSFDFTSDRHPIHNLAKIFIFLLIGIVVLYIPLTSSNHGHKRVKSGKHNQHFYTRDAISFCCDICDMVVNMAWKTVESVESMVNFILETVGVYSKEPMSKWQKERAHTKEKKDFCRPKIFKRVKDRGAPKCEIVCNSMKTTSRRGFFKLKPKSTLTIPKIVSSSKCNETSTICTPEKM